MMEIIKALKCCQNLYQVVVCPCLGAIYSFEVVKKCKIFLPAQAQISGEHYRTIGPLVSLCYQYEEALVPQLLTELPTKTDQTADMQANRSLLGAYLSHNMTKPTK